MEMENQLNNGFCPKCGALLRDGVCPSCGYGESEKQPEMPNGFESNAEAGADSNLGSAMQPESTEGTQQRNYEKYQAGVNEYYQNGYDQQQQQNFYYQPTGNANYNNGQVPPKKSNKGPIILAIVAGVVCMIVVIAIVAVISGVKAYHKADSQEVADTDDEMYFDDYDDEELLDDKEAEMEDDWDSSDWDDTDTGYDEELLAFVDDIDWDDTSWKEEPENYTPDEVYDDYYECYISPCNCIDENVSYSMVHNSWEETDREQNVCIRVNYYQLEGDIPNLDDINEELRFQAGWPGDIYFDRPEEFAEEFEEYGPGYVVSVDSYVTYNDEEKISVVSDIYYESATSVQKLIYGVNVDLTSGEIIKNARVLDISDEFLEEYKDICQDQNGYMNIFDEFDNDDLREFFEDKDDLILYYTPCGLEVGINYETDERYGWFSATLTDYDKYLK